MSNLSRRRATARAGLASIEREQAAWRESDAAEADRRHREAVESRKAEREAEKARVKLTREDCEGAHYVRDQFGWHVVVRVNTKSVTVDTPYSWTETIPYAKVLEARS